VVFRMQTWRMLRHMMLAVAIIVCAVIVVAGIFFIGLDIAYANHVFKGVSVEGIYIGSLDRQAAIEKLRSGLDMQALNSDMVLSFNGHTWPLSLYEIDGYVDLEDTVDRAMSAGRDIPFYERWGRRAVFSGMDRDMGLVVHYDSYKLDSFISKTVGTINRPPINAAIYLNSNKLAFQRSQEGWILDEDQVRDVIITTLALPERTAMIQIEVTSPQLSDSQVGKVITVDKTNHILTLYNNMDIEKQYPIAVGMSSWPTPSGTFQIVSKTKNPTWVNPGSSWATTMPPYIPPGPGNPLGTRALATSASGVFIHGTYNSGSIGESVSHGCIRMLIADSEDIYERVPVGIPVLIF
jgi:lipoprotein-anchoring transpeptidase ErfK/SrfK